MLRDDLYSCSGVLVSGWTWAVIVSILVRSIGFYSDFDR